MSFQLFPDIEPQQQHGLRQGSSFNDDATTHPSSMAPFYCDYYNMHECASCDPALRLCENVHMHVERACYALWTEARNGSRMLIHKGCWSFPQTTRMCSPLSDRCAVGQSTSHYALNGDELFFCCCEHSKCNLRYEHDASLQRPRTTNVDLPPMLANETNNFRLRARPQSAAESAAPFNVLLLVASFLSVAVVAVLLYFCYRRWKYGADGSADVSVAAGRNGNATSVAADTARWPWRTKAWRALFRTSASDGKRSGWRRCMASKGQDASAAPIMQPYIALDEKYVIARGRHGKIYAAPCSLVGLDAGDFGANCSDAPVAVKVFANKDAGSWATERDIYRVQALRRCSHVLRFLDARKNGADFWLITEYHARGSVHDFLKSHTLSLDELLHVSTTLLAGLAFLHEEVLSQDEQLAKPAIVHRDLKSLNVLLKADLTACLADFGLAVKCEQGCTPKGAHNQVGTYRYMAPEVLEAATEQSAFAYKQIDVYAAALILWELLSRCKIREDTVVGPHMLPYEKELGDAPEPTSVAFLNFVCKERRRPEFSAVCLNDKICGAVCHAVTDMWDQEPEARITARCALERVRSLQRFRMQTEEAGGHYGWSPTPSSSVDAVSRNPFALTATAADTAAYGRCAAAIELAEVGRGVGLGPNRSDEMPLLPSTGPSFLVT